MVELEIKFTIRQRHCLEAPQELRLLEKVRMHALERRGRGARVPDPAGVVARALGAVDGAHAAAAEGIQDPVTGGDERPARDRRQDRATMKTDLGPLVVS